MQTSTFIDSNEWKRVSGTFNCPNNGPSIFHVKKKPTLHVKCETICEVKDVKKQERKLDNDSFVNETLPTEVAEVVSETEQIFIDNLEKDLTIEEIETTENVETEVETEVVEETEVEETDEPNTEIDNYGSNATSTEEIQEVVEEPTQSEEVVEEVAPKPRRGGRRPKAVATADNVETPKRRVNRGGRRVR